MGGGRINDAGLSSQHGGGSTVVCRKICGENHQEDDILVLARKKGRRENEGQVVEYPLIFGRGDPVMRGKISEEYLSRLTFRA